MKKFSVICAAALALTAPGIAQAASTVGNHTFVGDLEVRKNLGLWTTCPVTAVINVSTGGTPTLSSVAVGGGGTCALITFTVVNGSLNLTGLPTGVVSDVRVDIAAIPLLAPADACQGNLRVYWGGNTANPRTLSFFDGGATGGALSNILDANPDNPGATENDCRIKGVLRQTLPTPTSLSLP